MASHIPISSFPTIHFKGISTPHIATHNSTATNPCSCKQCLCRYLYVPLPSGLSLKTHEGRLLVSEVPKAWVFGWGQSEWTCFYSNIKLPAGFGLSQRNGANQRYNYCFFFCDVDATNRFPLCRFGSQACFSSQKFESNGAQPQACKKTNDCTICSQPCHVGNMKCINSCDAM